MNQMVEKAVVIVKRSADVWATYEVGEFDYNGEDEFIQRREQLRELLKRIKWE